jgi:hypothetical protein
MPILRYFSPLRRRSIGFAMSAPAHLPIAGSAARSYRWWDHASDLAEQTNPAPGEPVLRASFRLGNAMLDLDTTYAPLLDDFRHAYRDCAVSAGTPDVTHRVRCSVRFIEERSLVVLHVDAPAGLPHLCDVALCLIRPRAELQHFFDRPLDRPGWRLIASALDENLPLLAAGAGTAIVDVRVEPPELLLNFVVGVAQLVQRSIIFIHAGGVSIDGRGTLLIGRSGRGKSTTTMALASRGHALLGDETVGIRAQPCEIVPFRRTLKLRPGPRAHTVAQRLNTVPHTLRADAQGVLCAWVGAQALFPGLPPAVATPLRDAFFLRGFGETAAAERFVPSLEHLEELQALTMSLSAIVSWPASPAHRLIRFARVIGMFSTCRCHFLDLGTPDDTAALIERTVKNHATECA